MSGLTRAGIGVPLALRAADASRYATLRRATVQAPSPGLGTLDGRHASPRFAPLQAHGTGTAHRPGAALAAGLAVAAALSLAACERAQSSPPPLRVAAASSLAGALEELAGAFGDAGGRQVVFGFASSAQLAQQLRAGAPFDAFAAADPRYTDLAIDAGVCERASRRRLGRGALALWSRSGAEAPPTGLAALADPRFRRIAIAHPELAPYGAAAVAALKAVGIWPQVQARIVHGENVRQALQFAAAGEADVAITALSLVIADRQNPWQLVDVALHPPLLQELVVCLGGHAEADARAFAAFIDCEAGRAVLRRHGLLPPGPP